jgi:transcriptional regulator with XRE-family HTH domain
LLQKEIAITIGIHPSNYSRVETGDRDLSIDAIGKIAKYFSMTIDQLVNFEGDIPQEVTIEDKSLVEQIKLIQGLELEEKNMVFKMVDTFLTQKKFKDFFQKNVATL